MSRPIEDSPSLVDVLAREHAARAARIAEEAQVSLAAGAARLAEEAEPAAAHVDQVDAYADTAFEAPLDATTIIAPPSRASSPRILVEELTRECARRRAALDDEARR